MNNNPMSATQAAVSVVLVICLFLPAMVRAAPLTWNGSVIGWTDASSRDWLRLDLADLQDRTYTDYVSGIQYAGRSWRLAGIDEVLGLWNEFAPYVHDSGKNTTGRYQTTALAALAFMDAFGVTQAASGGRRWVRGYSADVTRDVNGNLLFITSPYLYLDYSGTVAGIDYYAEEIWDSGSVGYPGSGYDAWLVATVPVPAAIWLFGSGLLGFIAFARHRS